MRRARITLSLPILVACLACWRGEAARDSTAALGTSNVRATPGQVDSSLKEFESRILRLGHSRDSIARTLGPSASIEVVEAMNAEGERDSLITLRYPAVTFILRKSPDGQEYFSNVIVADSGFKLPMSIAPGRTSQAELVATLGDPHRTIAFSDSLALTYDIPSGPVLQFYFLGSVLRKVRWVYEDG